MKNYLFFILATVLAFSLFSCKDSKEQKESIKLINTIKTKVPEPSDLCLSYDEKALWTVSDEENEIYLLSFEGKILETIKVDGNDLEGVTAIDDTTLAVILERDRIVVKLTTSGKELSRKKYSELKGKLNAGLEGITYNPINGHFFMVNEKTPCLFIETDTDLNIIKKEEWDYTDDISGIFYDKKMDCLWIISDENNSIMKCDLNGKMFDSIRVTVPQMEGIAVDHTNNRVYAISDITGELFVYKLSE